jgi:hypothetical protein
MSGWDAYINALRGDGSVITGAAIYGQAAQPGMWAASSTSVITADEIKTAYSALTNQATFDSLSAHGKIKI